MSEIIIEKENNKVKIHINKADSKTDKLTVDTKPVALKAAKSEGKA